MSAVSVNDDAGGVGGLVTQAALEALERHVAALAERGQVVLVEGSGRRPPLCEDASIGWDRRAPVQAPCRREITAEMRDVLSRAIDARLWSAHETVPESARSLERTAAFKAERLSCVVDAVPDLIWSMTGDGQLICCNDLCRGLIGASRGECVATVLADRLHADDREQRNECWSQARQCGEPYSVEYRLHAAGEARWYLERGTPMRDEPDGKVLAWAVSATPIESQKRLEEGLRSALRAREDFLVTLLHELRNPLAPIANALELLGCAPSDGQTMALARGILKRQFGQLSRLVGDLIDSSQLASAQFTLKPRAVELHEVLTVAVDEARPIIGLRRHELSIESPQGPIPLRADPERLAQVLSNLLVNAAKYTPVGGHIKVVLEQGAHEVRVRVCDNGIGIAPGKLSEIFGLFSRAAPASWTECGGLGVGLAVARHLTELHGGRISAHSEGEGRGSEFTVSLPRWGE